MLRDYLATRLDGQLGRAAAHFHRYLPGAGTGSGVGPNGSPRRRGPSFGGGGWVVGIVGGALAASIAALWAGPSLRTYPAAPAPSSSSAAAGPAASAMNLRMEEQTLCSQTSDGGTVLLDERTAARRLIRKELKQTRWVDSKTGASLEKFEPRQDVMLIQLEKY